MPDDNAATPSPESFKDAAKRSQEAGIADESAAYESATEGSDNEHPAAADGEPEARPS